MIKAGKMSEKAERYINQQTARRVISVCCGDIEKMQKTGDTSKAADIIKSLENVRDSLIGG